MGNLGGRLVGQDDGDDVEAGAIALGRVAAEVVVGDALDLAALVGVDGGLGAGAAGG